MKKTSKLLVFVVITLISIVLCGGCATPESKLSSKFMIRDGDRVVFVGDGVADGSWCPTFIRAFVATRHPNWRNTFLNRGVSGDNASSVDWFERDVVALEPDVAVFMMGYNALKYGKPTSERLGDFLKNVERCCRMIRSKSPEARLLLVSSSLNNAFPSHESRKVARIGNSSAFPMLEKLEANLAAKLDMPFLDARRCSGGFALSGRGGARELFAFSKKGGQSLRPRQLLLATCMLEKMRADATVAFLHLNSEEATVVKAEKCEVRKATWSCEGEFVFERRCEALPFPMPLGKPSEVPKLIHLNDRLSRDILKVSKLDSEAFELLIDGKSVALLRKDEFEAGINLSDYDTPMRRRSLKVLDAARKLDELQNAVFSLIRKNKLDGSGRPTERTPSEIKTKLIALKKEMESARLALYSINKPMWRKFMLRPSKKVPNPAPKVTDAPLKQ